MQFGVLIDEGPMQWQIIQQTDGHASISLAGRWRPAQGAAADVTDSVVQVRIVSEDDGFPVLPWQPCQTNPDGTWNTVLTGIPAGGLYRLESCLTLPGNAAVEWSLRGDMIHHIGVGDLYVIAGQSNSAGYGKDPAYDPPELGVHVLRNSGRWDLATHPLNESTDTRHEANRETANPGHSPYVMFGKRLKQATGWPVGLLQAALGGSPLSAWNPDEDGTLYRLMQDVITAAGGRIRGLLWYQGCSDTDHTASLTYLQRFSAMVGHLRHDLGQADLPVLTIQLNRHIAPAEEAKNLDWGRVREAQRLAAATLQHVYVIPANDCSVSDEIHNDSPSNLVLGERLARLAAAVIYGRGRLCLPPEIMAARQTAPAEAELTIKHLGSRLIIFTTPVGQFPFTFVDQQGHVPVTSWSQPADGTVLVQLTRPLSGAAVVHGLYEQNPTYAVPRDVDGYLPMLSFLGFPVQSV